MNQYQNNSNSRNRTANEKFVLDFLDYLVSKKQFEYYKSNNKIKNTDTIVKYRDAVTQFIDNNGQKFCNIILEKINQKNQSGGSKYLIKLPEEEIYGEINDNDPYELLLLKNYINGNYIFSYNNENNENYNGSKNKSENFIYLIDNLKLVDNKTLTDFYNKISTYYNVELSDDEKKTVMTKRTQLETNINALQQQISSNTTSARNKWVYRDDLQKKEKELEDLLHQYRQARRTKSFGGMRKTKKMKSKSKSRKMKMKNKTKKITKNN